MKTNTILTISILGCLALMLMAASLENSGQQMFSESSVLTASKTIYLPSSGGIPLSDDEYFGVELMCDDASGDAISATVGLQVSFDESNWTSYTQTVFYPVAAAAAATLSPTGDGTYYHSSIHPMPCPYVRFYITEGGAQADVTCYIKVFGQ